MKLHRPARAHPAAVRAAARRAVGRRVLHGLAVVPRTGLRRRLPPHAQRAGPRLRGDVRRRVPRRSTINLGLARRTLRSGRRSCSAPASTAGRSRSKAAGSRGIAVRGRPRSSACSSASSASRRLAGVAELLQRRAVRRHAIRSSGATSRSTSSGCRSGRSLQRAGAASRWPRAASAAGCYYVLSGSFVIEARYGAGVLAALPPDAGRPAPPVAARRGALRPAGLGRVARRFRRRCSRRRRSCFGASYADVHAQHSVPLGRRSACSSSAPGSPIWHGFGRRGWPIPLAVGLVPRRHDHRRPLRRLRPELRRHAERARQGAAVHPYNIAATRKAYALDRVDERELSGDAELNAGGHRRQRGHHRERPAVGPPAAAPDVRADSGNPDVLRLHQRRQRPLRDRRQVPAGHALGPRAEHREHAESIVGQRAADLHARLRPHARPGQPGHDRRSAGALHPEPAAGRRRSISSSSEPSIYFGELSSTYVLVKHAASRSSTIRAATTTSRRRTRARAACRSARFLRRLLFAMRFGTTDILVTNQITADSRILFHRQIGERVTLARAVSAVRHRSLSGRQRRAARTGCRTRTRRRPTTRTRRRRTTRSRRRSTTSATR